VQTTLSRATELAHDAATNPFAVCAYNNFADTGPEKGDPRAVDDFKPAALAITVDGPVRQGPGTSMSDAFLTAEYFRRAPPASALHRTWSIVVPWTGVPLAAA